MITPSFQLDRLSEETGVRISGGAEEDWTGWSVSGLGDVNGDGIDDFAIGARYADPNGLTDAGTSYIIFGSADGLSGQIDVGTLDGVSGFAIYGLSEMDFNGFPVSRVGDFNGDGFNDMAVSSAVADPKDLRGAGEVYMIFGTDQGFAPIFDLATLNGTNGFEVEGLEAERRLGRALSSAGDINGDGLDDIVIGAAGYDPANVNYNGYSYVVFGNRDALDPNFDLSTLDGVNGFVIHGAQADDRAGFSVSEAGDVNGDGIDDLLIGARFAARDGNLYAGEAYVVFGTDQGFDSQLELADLDGTNGFSVTGLVEYDGLGFSVSSTGDINNDGFADVVIGARSADPQGRDEGGVAYVVFGSSAGFDASFDLTSLDGSNGFRLEGASAFDFLSHGVTEAGDFNGDGIDDFAISAPRSDATGVKNGGAVYVVFGRELAFDAVLDVENLGVEGGLVIRGVASGDEAGYAIDSAGDINNDGFDDLIIGAPTADTAAGADAGEVYIVYGFASGTPIVAEGDGADNTMYGSFMNDTLRGRSGNDTLYGLAGDDILAGDAGNDELYGAEGNDRLRGGGGNDVLQGGDGNDRLYGGGGSDVLIGGNGNDIYQLTDLNDRIVEGADGGYDVVRVGVENYVMDSFVEELRLAEGIYSATGSARDDVMVASNSGSSMNGRSGHDVMLGGAGIDILRGANGDDTIFGFGGNDSLSGNAGLDTLVGGDGDDRYTIDDEDIIIEVELGGFDTVYSTINFTLSANVEELRLLGNAATGRGNNGDNAIYGTDLGNFIYGEDGNDILYAFGGNDLLIGGAGIDTMLGGDGDDIYVIDDLGDHVIETRDGGYDVVRTAVSGYEIDRFVEQVRLIGAADSAFGGNSDDHIVGAGNDDSLVGRNGNDHLVGRQGDDRLDGGSGDDRLEGGRGSDVLQGRTGADVMLGGDGDDVYFVDEVGDRVIERLNNGIDFVVSEVDFRLGSNVENLRLKASAFQGIGNDLANKIEGNDLANRLLGGDGDDLLFGFAGSDKMEGGRGSDTLLGGDGDDWIGGRAGHDILIGGAGADILIGHQGSDIFVFNDETDSIASSMDSILDFSSLEGDKIDLSALDAVSGTAENDGFTFIGEAAFTSTAGELRYEQIDGATFVHGDVDGDGTADIVINLANQLDLTAADFIV